MDDARPRDKAQAEYVEDFFGAVVAFLAFPGNHADLADRVRPPWTGWRQPCRQEQGTYGNQIARKVGRLNERQLP